MENGRATALIERGNLTVEGQIRVLKDANETRIRHKITTDHPVLSWLVEFAAVLVNRYEVGHDGKTPCERLRGKQSRLLGLEFGLQGYTLSGETIVGTLKGVMRTRTVRRKAAERRWSVENLRLVTGVPWQPAPGDDVVENTMPSLELPVADPEVEIRRPEVREKEYVPRRIYLREKDFEEFGRTVGCKGCLAKMRGAVHAIHSDACRARMQREMQDEGRRRVREASERIEVHCRDIHEERAAKRVKHDEITEQASSNREAPSYIRVGPADVETKEMDTEEQAKAKRDHGCEHLEDGVKRAKRMEHHENDDGDVLMDLACTGDFEEHCELTAESEQEQKNVEDKVCWADESDEPEFRDNRLGGRSTH